MKKITRRLAALCAVLLMVGALAGCGRTRVTLEKYPDTVVATLGDQKVYLDEANFFAMTSQYTTELYYTMYGMDITDMWSADIGTGATMEDYTKESVMKGICQTYVLKAKAEELGLSLDDSDLAKVEEAVSQTMEQMDETVKEATNITEERLREIVTTNALAMKAYQYAVKDVDTEVSDEEAAQRTIRYILVKDGEDAEAAKTLAEEIKGRVEAGENSEEAMQAIADENENASYVTNTYGAGDFDNAVGDLGMTLKTGEIGSTYDSGYGWYIVYCVTDFDEEATENEKPSIVEQRKSELFQTVYAEWLGDMPDFKVDEKVWAVVTFDKTMFEVPETTAAEMETAAEETSAAETAAD